MWPHGGISNFLGRNLPRLTACRLLKGKFTHLFRWKAFAFISIVFPLVVVVVVVVVIQAQKGGDVVCGSAGGGSGRRGDGHGHGKDTVVVTMADKGGCDGIDSGSGNGCVGGSVFVIGYGGSGVDGGGCRRCCF